MTLHVRSMTLTTDTQHPQLDVPFNVTVSIRVREKVAQLQDVYLPTFFGPEELGDVRSVQQGPAGTLYRETLTLEAHSRGPLTITPGYMDTIDARDGKPKRFFTNALRLYVEGGPVGDFWAPVRMVLGAILTLAIVCIAFFAGVRIVRGSLQTKIVPQTQPAPVAPQPPPEPPPHETLGTTVEHLRSHRNRANALAVRAALRQMIGAGSGETLGDVLLRSRGAPESFRQTLVAAERAAFVDDGRLAGAIDELLAHLGENAIA